MMSTDAVPDKSSRQDTPLSQRAMPSRYASPPAGGRHSINTFSAALRPGSDRTWSAIHGITFASSSERTPTHNEPHLIHAPSQEAGLQNNTRLWTEQETQQHTGARDENLEGPGNVVSAERPMHLLQTQHGRATGNPNSSDDNYSSESAGLNGCPPPDDEEFRTPLGFHIPKAKLQNAMLAEPNSTASYWHFTLYQGPGGDKDKVKVHYCKTKETTEKIAQLFLDEKVLGFDIEWKPSSKSADGITKNVALIQIASEERVLLAHLARYPNTATPETEQHVEDFVSPSLKIIMYGLSPCCFDQYYIPFELQNMLRE